MLGELVWATITAMDEQSLLGEALTAYERATFGGDMAAAEAGDRALDLLEAKVALARGRLAHARFLATRQEPEDEQALFVRAVELFERRGDQRGEAEARFWLATYYQVVAADHATAAPLLDQAERLARATGEALTLSYVLRHQSFVDQDAGRLAEAERRMRESTALREELGFVPGVAANLIGLAHLAVASGRDDEAPERLRRAAELAATSGAHGVVGWVEAARSDLGLGV